MELTDRFEVSASPAEAWAFLWNLPRVAKCLPGCESIEDAGGGAYRARMTQRVGPFKVTLDLEMRVDEAEEGQRVVVSGNGKDRMGNRLHVNRLALELSEPSQGWTELTYAMDFNLYGRLATLGNTAVKRKSEEIRAEFSRRIAEELGG
ncbi:MAG: SRPBCC domain-containing protein [Chloroflexi bacterium]|nr:SRPBCC domain-containing protein [Chloroflexota bacterium]